MTPVQLVFTMMLVSLAMAVGTFYVGMRIYEQHRNAEIFLAEVTVFSFLNALVIAVILIVYLLKSAL